MRTSHVGGRRHRPRDSVASFLGEAAPQPTGHSSEDLAPGGDTLLRPSPDSAHSSSACTSHQLQPRASGIIGEEELCVACWSPSHSGRVHQATQQGVPAPSNLPRPQGQTQSPRPEARGPGVQFSPSHRCIISLWPQCPHRTTMGLDRLHPYAHYVSGPRWPLGTWKWRRPYPGGAHS